MRNEIKLNEDLFMPTIIVQLEDISFSMKAILCLIIQVIKKNDKFNYTNHAISMQLGIDKYVVSRSLARLQALRYIDIIRYSREREIEIGLHTIQILEGGIN